MNEFDFKGRAIIARMKVIKVIFVILGYLIAGYVSWIVFAMWLQSANPNWGESDSNYSSFGYASKQAGLLALVITVCLLVGFHFARKKLSKHK